MSKRSAGKWHMGVTAIVIALAGCGGGDGTQGSPTGPGTSAPAPTPTPTPTPTPSPTYVGAVYAGTNDPGGNAVVGFGRRTDGGLVPLDRYDTGGTGRAFRSPGQPSLNPLIAEDSILAVDDRFLLVVNAGSNDVTSFRINADFSLTRADLEASGGTAPVSLAYHDGVVYVANADEDGAFTGPQDQSGNVTAMRLDAATGRLTRIAGVSLSLRGRPSDLEVTPDGAYLLASSLNAESPQLPAPGAAEVSSFRIATDGTLAATPSGSGTSTALNNAAKRNLPNAIGIETYAEAGRQFVVAAEARSVSSTGAPASFATLQTGSVSTWEIATDGALLPRTQDFRLGPSVTSGPMQAAFLAYSPDYSTFWVTTVAGATITGFGLYPDGATTRGELLASGSPVDPAAPDPFADADGWVDLAISPDHRWLYQLVGLKRRIDVYEIDTFVAISIARRQQVTTNLLPADNLQGLVAVEKATP